MVYITSVERILREKGRTLGLAEGKAEALRQAILMCVEEKWGTPDRLLVEKLGSLASSDELNQVFRLAVRAETELEWRAQWC